MAEVPTIAVDADINVTNEQNNQFFDYLDMWTKLLPNSSFNITINVLCRGVRTERNSLRNSLSWPSRDSAHRFEYKPDRPGVDADMSPIEMFMRYGRPKWKRRMRDLDINSVNPLLATVHKSNKVIVYAPICPNLYISFIDSNDFHISTPIIHDILNSSRIDSV
jgi:hypothetical protein